MAKVEDVSIAITAEMAALMRRLVDAGEYASESEVVREALRDWAFRRNERERAVDALRELWDAGLASGPSIDGEMAFAEISERLDADYPLREER